MNLRRYFGLPFFGLLTLALAIAQPVGAVTSHLWGNDGSNWTPQSRLPDYSYAGYRGGLQAIPDLPVKANVKNYGAIGDGLTDDTTAFIQAIAAVSGGAVIIPQGRYKITQVLRITKPGVVLKGEGIDKTILYFPKSLTEAGEVAPGGSWSWSGAWISFEGEDRTLRLGHVTAPAQRGNRTITVSSNSAIVPGQWVRLLMTDTDGTLVRHIYNGKENDLPDATGQKLVDFVSPVESVNGNQIVLKRPLRTDVQLAWEPEIWAHNPSVYDVGIEGLGIEFPTIQYAGHHDEPGYNAISFEGVSHGWVRRVHIVNADSGIFLRSRTKFCSVDSVSFSVYQGRLRTGYGRDLGEPTTLSIGGHHGILALQSYDNLVSNFSMNFRFIHDISVSAWSSGNVFSEGSGIDLDIDHHRRGPYENLFTEIQVGEGGRLWQTAGDLVDGPPAGVRETYWNIQAGRSLPLPSWSVVGNFVGITSSGEPQGDNDWFEAVLPQQLVPANLYKAQRAMRDLGNITGHSSAVISGRILDASGRGISEITVRLSGLGSQTTITGTDGSFKFIGIDNGGYTVTPAKPGYVCLPGSMSFNVVSTGVVSNCDFTVSALATGDGGAVNNLLNVLAAREMRVMGSSERRGIINPDKGDSAEILFKGTGVGRFECRIFKLTQEVIWEDALEDVSEGKFTWTPIGIATGSYVVHVKGPGINNRKQVAVIR